MRSGDMTMDPLSVGGQGLETQHGTPDLSELVRSWLNPKRAVHSIWGHLTHRVM